MLIADSLIQSARQAAEVRLCKLLEEVSRGPKEMINPVHSDLMIVVSLVGLMAKRGSFQHARLVHVVAQSQQHGGPVAR